MTFIGLSVMFVIKGKISICKNRFYSHMVLVLNSSDSALGQNSNMVKIRIKINLIGLVCAHIQRFFFVAQCYTRFQEQFSGR